MSTRGVIEICDRDGDGRTRLYHHSDSMPSFMLPKIERFIKGSYKYLNKIGLSEWSNDPSQVAAIWVLLSIQDYDNPIEPCVPSILQDKNKRLEQKAPRFIPMIDLPADIEFFYKVYLLGNGNANVEVYSTRYTERSHRLRKTLRMNPMEVRIWLKNQKKEK